MEIHSSPREDIKFFIIPPGMNDRIPLSRRNSFSQEYLSRLNDADGFQQEEMLISMVHKREIFEFDGRC